ADGAVGPQGPAGPAGADGASGMNFAGDDVVSIIPDARTASVALGADGNPVVVFEDVVQAQLKAAFCNDPRCSTYESRTLVDDADRARIPKVVITDSGNPVIAYRHTVGTDSVVNLIYCSDPRCETTEPRQGFQDSAPFSAELSLLSSMGDGGVITVFGAENGVKVGACVRVLGECHDVTAITLDTSSGEFSGSDVIRGADGLPTIAYSFNAHSEVAQVSVVRCLNPTCSSFGPESVVYAAPVGPNSVSTPSLALGEDGRLRVSFAARVNGISSTYVVTCADPACSSADATASWVSATPFAPELVVAVDGDLLVMKRDSNLTGASSPTMLNVIRCLDLSCSERATMKITDNTGHTGLDPVATVGVTGTPFVVSQDLDAGLVLRSCVQQHCSPFVRAGL
ncbi:MAG: hypothetical protein ACO39Q_10750, partial [Ilumatobacteraceae bacterium]